MYSQWIILYNNNNNNKKAWEKTKEDHTGIHGISKQSQNLR